MRRSSSSRTAIRACISASCSISKASFEKPLRRSSIPHSTAPCSPILIILLFLHSWRSTLIVAVSLPVSILGTLFAAYVFGYSLNIMTLGGLALAVGLIVDDAIVVIENIYRHMALGQTPMEAAETATAEILSAVMASSITVITVFVPLVLIPGLQGLLFTPFAVMVMVGGGVVAGRCGYARSRCSPRSFCESVPTAAQRRDGRQQRRGDQRRTPRCLRALLARIRPAIRTLCPMVHADADARGRPARHRLCGWPAWFSR